MEGLGHKGSQSPCSFNPVSWLPSTRGGCPGLYPTWPWALQGMDTHSSSGQMCQGLSTLWVTNLPQTSNLSSLFLKFKTFPTCPVMIRLCKKLISLFFPLLSIRIFFPLVKISILLYIIIVLLILSNDTFFLLIRSLLFKIIRFHVP